MLNLFYSINNLRLRKNFPHQLYDVYEKRTIGVLIYLPGIMLCIKTDINIFIHYVLYFYYLENYIQL